MSKLEEFLKKECPDGVEYKQIKDIAKINRGIIISKKYIEENKGDYPVYSSQTENNGELGRINNYAYDGEYLTWTTDGANAGSVFYRNEKFNITNVCGLIKITEDNIITKFVYYILHIYAPKYVNRGMGNCKLMSNVMESISIPIPPIEVQKEIVRILDTFTKYQDLLNRELELRKKQYEYYRDKLLSFGDEVEKIQLKDLFYTKNGYTPSKSNPEFWDSKDVSWFRMEDIRENGRILNEAIQKVSFSAIKGNVFPKNSIIVSTSATIGEHALITCESLANQRFTYLILKDEYKNKFNIFFLFYYCYKLKEYCLNCLNQGNFASVDMTKFNKFEFPIISLKEQERIVKILDQFDTLCNDITRGLPAEIELRKKQYEYYRDKLLTFKEKKK
ncbi:restriction endonuclease subunit S [Brachyspira pilosicoli]|uniref:restriction endonuclease subunit S n=1 Tax=Brachyspira pilosicoli TaxID=52584 RepID=UPI0030052BEA